MFDLFCVIEEEQVSAGELKNAYLLFHIFKSVFLLNDSAVLEVVLSDAHILDLIAVLEYDPLLPEGTSHRRHREFLEKVRMRVFCVLLCGRRTLACMHKRTRSFHRVTHTHIHTHTPLYLPPTVSYPHS